MALEFIAVLLLFTPIIYFLFLAYLKNKYFTASIIIFLFITFVASLGLAAFKYEGALAVTICSVIAVALSIFLKKIYLKFLDAGLTPIIESVSEGDLLSPTYVTKDRVYAITSKGYLVIQYNKEDYVLYEHINEAPAIDRAIFTTLSKRLKTGDDLEQGT